MKRILKIMFLILLIILFAFPSYALRLQGSECSGEQTADATIHSGPCYITGLLVITDGTNDATIVLYDNTAASGTVRWEQKVKGADNYGGRNWSFPKFFRVGIYADIDGTGASYIVEKIPR